jgi:hypothetical protein
LDQSFIDDVGEFGACLQATCYFDLVLKLLPPAFRLPALDGVEVDSTNLSSELHVA